MKKKETEDFFKNLDQKLETDFFNLIKQIVFLEKDFKKKNKSSEVNELFTYEELEKINYEFHLLTRASGSILGYYNRLSSIYKKMEDEQIKEQFKRMKQTLDKAQDICDKLDLEKTNIKSLEDMFKFVYLSEQLSEKDKRVTINFLKEMFKS